MLVQNHFPFDVRVRNESALLRDEGYEVTVICLKRKGEKDHEAGPRDSCLSHSKGGVF